MDFPDISFHLDIIRQEFVNAALEQQRPAILMRPALSIDGNQWCALYGENIQDGLSGFGSSPYAALIDFDRQFFKEIAATEEK